MARVKSPPSPPHRRLEKLLIQRFPSPASVKLEDHDGIFGVITSLQFSGMETIDRQELIGSIVAGHLTPEERRRVLVIVGVTPDEGTGISGRRGLNSARLLICTRGSSEPEYSDGIYEPLLEEAE